MERIIILIYLTLESFLYIFIIENPIYTWHCFLFQYALLGAKLFFSDLGRQMPHSILGPFPSDYCTHLRTMGTAVAQWLRHCATNRKVAGSISDGVNGIFH